jgi:hypothetical protein
MKQQRCLQCGESGFCCGRFGRQWLALRCQCVAWQFVSRAGHLWCDGNADCANAFGTWSEPLKSRSQLNCAGKFR